MKIKNNTSEDIIIVCDGEEFECTSESFIKIQTNQNEITVKQPEQNILNCFKVFKYDDKNSIKGNVIYFQPGFYLNYATKISFDQSVREINITKFDFVMHGFVVFSMFIPKEKSESIPVIENNLVKKLLFLFISLFAVPLFSFLAGLVMGCTYGLFFDFDWILLIMFPIVLLLLWVFSQVSKDLYALLKPEKNYDRILKNSKQIIIKRLNKHFISFIESDFAIEKYGLKDKRRK